MNRWVLLPAPRPDPPLRLFCLPAAGSGASMYRDWQRRLPPEVETLPVQLPGRESRLVEPPAEEYVVAVASLAEGLGPLLDKPHVLFGHSMGALLAFGLAQYRRDRGLRAPERLIVSGMPAPHRYDRIVEQALADADDACLITSLIERGGTDGAALANSELLALVLPTLRADYRVCATMPLPDAEPFDFPISVLAGTEDDLTTNALAEWERWSRAETTVQLFPGGHFFLTEPSKDAVVKVISRALATTLNRGYLHG